MSTKAVRQTRHIMCRQILRYIKNADANHAASSPYISGKPRYYCYPTSIVAGN